MPSAKPCTVASILTECSRGRRQLLGQSRKGWAEEQAGGGARGGGGEQGPLVLILNGSHLVIVLHGGRGLQRASTQSLHVGRGWAATGACVAMGTGLE